MGCNSPVEKGKSFDFHRLIGRWESVSDRKRIEEWKWVNDSVMTGEGFVLSGADTMFVEMLRIDHSSLQPTYTAMVPDEHGDEKVPFKMITNSAKEIAFENKDNDFPHRIVYLLESDSTMLIYIEGPQDGQITRKDFDFKRVKVWTKIYWVVK